MKRFPGLILILILLTGCAAHAQQTLSSEAAPLAESIELYDAGSPLEAFTHGAIRCYPLDSVPCNGLLSSGSLLLLFETAPEYTVISRLDTETGAITASRELPFSLDSRDPTLHPWNDGFSCYDPVSRNTVLMDGDLNIAGKIPAPPELMGAPILSTDGNSLFYCTDRAIRALDLQTGISRVLKEAAYPGQQVSGLLLEDSVVQCEVHDGAFSLFLSTQSGSTAGSSDRVLSALSHRSNFYAELSDSGTYSLVYGSLESEIRTLLFPDAATAGHTLPESHSVVTTKYAASGMLQLDQYDLSTGRRTASVSFPADAEPKCFVSLCDGSIWFLSPSPDYSCDILCCWQPSLSSISDDRNYSEIYFTEASPNREALAQCVRYAQQLSEKFGIEILVYEDVNALRSTDYRLTQEYLAPVLLWELEMLEKSLSNYPQDFLQTLVSRFDGLTIGIVRQIRPTSPSGASENPDSVQFWDGHRACIALASGRDTERGLYHMLCHLIDTIVLNESSAYDTWSGLNPAGFAYDYDYAANRSRNSTAYLLDSSRYFVDMFSMSFPKEDRARIMEYAMTPGNEALFQGPFMQAKLHTLCFGIREAFQMEDSPQVLLWEQYLHTSLTPAS